MTLCVLDSSVAISWFMPDEIAALDILDKIVKEGAIVPTIWLLEIGNVLLCAKRAKRLTLLQLQQALYTLKELPIKIDQSTMEHSWFEAMELAESHDLTLYDASYLELAMRHGLPLATFDKQLKKTCYTLGIITI